MLRQFGNKLTFAQVEDRFLFAVDILDTETKETGQVQDEEKREICEHAALTGIQVQKGVFDKIEQLGVGFGLLQAFLQQLDHKEGYRIF